MGKLKEYILRLKDKKLNILGYLILFVTVISLNILPDIFPEFFFGELSGENIFGRFENPTHAVYGLILGVAGFIVIPFLAVIAIFCCFRLVSKKWYMLIGLSIFSFIILYYVLMYKYVYYCGDFVKAYYGNTFVDDWFDDIVFGYPIALSVLALVWEWVRDYLNDRRKTN